MTASVPNKGVVLFDGDCAFCQRSIRIVKGLDWLNRLDYQNARETDKLPKTAVPLQAQKLIEEMHVVTPDRQRSYAGFAAWRWMSWRLPLTFLSTPLLYIPGVPWLGDKVYRWVARNRSNLMPCADGGCQVNLKKPSA